MKSALQNLVDQQVSLLNNGKVLEALDIFYSDDCVMYNNDNLFASGKEESRTKQEPFILPCTEICGNISKYIIRGGNISVLRNESSFTHPQYGNNKIDGLHVQYWKDGKIIKELYYQDEMLDEKVKEWLI